MVIPAGLQLQKDADVGERPLRVAKQLVVRVRVGEDDGPTTWHGALGRDEHDAVRLGHRETREQERLEHGERGGIGA